MLAFRRRPGEAVVIAERMLLTLVSVVPAVAERPPSVWLRTETATEAETFELAQGQSRPVLPGIEVAFERGCREGGGNAQLYFFAKTHVPIDRLEVWVGRKLGLPSLPRDTSTALACPPR